MYGRLHSFLELRKLVHFFKQPNVSRQLVKAGRRQAPACPELELARELGWDWGRATGFRPQEKGRGVLLDCACAEAGLRGGAAACGAA